ncbi:phosphatase PAP2 family protein [Bacteroidota bacterium]
MKVITGLGDERFLILFLLVLIVGVDFRKGFLLIQIVVITGLITELTKQTFELPRPWFLDDTLLTFNNKFIEVERFNSIGAGGFFEMLPNYFIEKYRLLKPDSYGFPSGHTSTALVLWGSLIIMFRKRGIKFLLLLIILIPLSRMYLARHFLADLLGGYIIGVLFLGIFYFVIYRDSKLDSFLLSPNMNFSPDLKNALILLYLLIIPVLISLFLRTEFIRISGYWFGVNIVFILLSRKKYPPENKKISIRIIKILITLSVLLIVGVIANQLLLINNSSVLLFISGSMVTMIGLYVSYRLIDGVKLFKKDSG